MRVNMQEMNTSHQVVERKVYTSRIPQEAFTSAIRFIEGRLEVRPSLVKTSKTRVAVFGSLVVDGLPVYQRDSPKHVLFEEYRSKNDLPRLGMCFELGTDVCRFAHIIPST